MPTELSESKPIVPPLEEHIARTVERAHLPIHRWNLRAFAFDVISPLTSGLYELEGESSAGSGASRVQWVLKHVRRPGAFPTDVAHPMYWKREVHAYETLSRKSAASPLRTPACIHVSFPGEDEALLWLERVPASEPRALGPAQYRYAASHLAQFNVLNSEGRAEDFPWLSRDLLPFTLDALWPGEAVAFLQAEHTWNHPLLKDVFAPRTAQVLLRLHEDRWRIFAAFARCPKGWSHLDAYQPNLLRVTPLETTAIDWACLGWAPLGQDAGQLLAGNVLWRKVGPEDADGFFDGVRSGYLQGLKAQGLDSREVGERAEGVLLLSAALRVAAFVPSVLQGLLSPDAERYCQAHFGMPLRPAIRDWAALLRWMTEKVEDGYHRLGLSLPAAHAP